jgi:hypothetical protein
MKLVTRLLSLILLAATVVFYSSCGGDDAAPKSETDTQLEKLNGTWVITSESDVTQDNDPPPFDYTGFKLTINATGTPFNYQTAVRPDLSPWPTSGTFDFGPSISSTLIRHDPDNDDITITYSVTETALVMTFQYDGTGFAGGRSKSVEGEWRFEFTKQ